MKDNYHHGNLKNELIETSIHIISQEGFEHLSLRNISSQCGVSHNAIYRHFDTKDQLIETCQNYVTERLMEYLATAISDAALPSDTTLKNLCAAYVSFYEQHPTYYSFLYRNSSTKIYFSLDDTSDNYPPVVLFRQVYWTYGKQKYLSDQECLTRLTSLWSFLHGLVALIISPNVVWDGNWQLCLENIIQGD